MAKGKWISFKNSPYSQAISGLAFGGFCLWLALRQVRIEQFKEAMGNAEVIWIVYALAFFGCDVMVRIFRWMLLLNTITRLTYRNVAAALICGHMVNNLLPARLGELYRADFVKRRHEVARTKVLGTIFIERMMDATAVSLALVIGLILAWQLNQSESPILNFVAVAAICGLLILASFAFNVSRTLKLVNRILPANLHRIGEDFSSSVAAIREGAVLLPVALTIIIYVFEFLTLHMILRAIGIEVGVAVTLLTLGAIVLSTLIPTAP
jgi:glycosyltransferase 2 family protein